MPITALSRYSLLAECGSLWLFLGPGMAMATSPVGMWVAFVLDMLEARPSSAPFNDFGCDDMMGLEVSQSETSLSQIAEPMMRVLQE